jgi:diguanylate cyclase (GGDEF)-like protein
LPDCAWQQDVLALLPPLEDTAHLDRVWRLTPYSSPLDRLTLWNPTGADDRAVRVAELPRLTALLDQAFKDDVTGLYNRRFLTIRLAEELAHHRHSGRPVSVVLLHLDGLARIGDELGIGAVDETLRAVAEILLRQTRGVNVVSRYDGGLFAIVLVETSPAGARLYADRLRYFVSTTTFGHAHRVTARFGTASLPEDQAATALDLVRRADQRLRAPMAGRP